MIGIFERSSLRDAYWYIYEWNDMFRIALKYQAQDGGDRQNWHNVGYWSWVISVWRFVIFAAFVCIWNFPR